MKFNCLILNYKPKQFFEMEILLIQIPFASFKEQMSKQTMKMVFAFSEFASREFFFLWHLAGPPFPSVAGS